jgi:hypothetical protein
VAADSLTTAAEDFLVQNPAYGNRLARVLGQGYNGRVWLTNKDLVLKITRDAEEARTTELIMAKANGRFTPKYFACVSLPEGLHTVVMESVVPVSLTAAQSRFLNLFRDRIEDLRDAGEDVRSILPGLQGLPDPVLVRVLTGLVNDLHGLSAIGIDHADIQEENLAWRGQQLVLLDAVHAGLLAESTFAQFAALLRRGLGILREHRGA